VTRRSEALQHRDDIRQQNGLVIHDLGVTLPEEENAARVVRETDAGAVIRGNSSFLTVGFIIVAFGWAWGARTIRSMALTLREREFINMARFSGANTFDILLREIFPYVTAYMLVGFINTVLFAINTEATLAVIGLSKVEVPTLGSIIFWALNYNALFTGNYVWLVAPIIATVLLFLGLFLSSTGFNAAFASKRGVL